MPIKHETIAGAIDTADIHQFGTGTDRFPIERVFEKGNGDPTIWERAPVGYWRTCYVHLTASPPFTGDFTNPYPVPPSAEEILALSSVNVITGSKRDIVVKFTLHEEDWRTATGAAGSFAMEAMGRGFLITRNWGLPAAIETNGSPAHTIYSPFSVVIHGMTYTGYIKNGSPAVYTGIAETIFRFGS